VPFSLVTSSEALLTAVTAGASDAWVVRSPSMAAETGMCSSAGCRIVSAASIRGWAAWERLSPALVAQQGDQAGHAGDRAQGADLRLRLGEGRVGHGQVAPGRSRVPSGQAGFGPAQRRLAPLRRPGGKKYMDDAENCGQTEGGGQEADQETTPLRPACAQGMLTIVLGVAVCVVAVGESWC